MTTAKPMQPPISQPIGFWTVQAGEAIRARTRGALSQAGLSQPEWWLLHQLSLFPGGVGRDEVIDKLGHNDTPQAIIDAISVSVAKGSVHEVDSILKSTTQGDELFRQGLKVQQMLQDERMHGVSDDDYVITIEVLQRIIKNVGAEVWHW